MIGNSRTPPPNEVSTDATASKKKEGIFHKFLSVFKGKDSPPPDQLPPTKKAEPKRD
jgi:hypothetical protein